ncbi:F-box protein [Cardamine amara subsp. amara]|uniref:F-box protein n=1 Tax=Cardamine amara subsp. amara TaxID=228776 RepID=A0ABD1BV28_CARAN
MSASEDVEKQVWTKYVYSLEEDGVITPYNHSIVGLTTTGEIVFFTEKSSKPYYVFYFNPERNTIRKVQIQGLEKYCNVFADVNLIEDLYVDDAKQLKSNQGLNIIRKRPKAY